MVSRVAGSGGRSGVEPAVPTTPAMARGPQHKRFAVPPPQSLVGSLRSGIGTTEESNVKEGEGEAASGSCTKRCPALAQLLALAEGSGEPEAFSGAPLSSQGLLSGVADSRVSASCSASMAPAAN